MLSFVGYDLCVVSPQGTKEIGHHCGYPPRAQRLLGSPNFFEADTEALLKLSVLMAKRTYGRADLEEIRSLAYDELGLVVTEVTHGHILCADNTRILFPVSS